MQRFWVLTELLYEEAYNRNKNFYVLILLGWVGLGGVGGLGGQWRLGGDRGWADLAKSPNFPAKFA